MSCALKSVIMGDNKELIEPFETGNLLSKLISPSIIHVCGRLIKE